MSPLFSGNPPGEAGSLRDGDELRRQSSRRNALTVRQPVARLDSSKTLMNELERFRR
jgi:hypothetical protein